MHTRIVWLVLACVLFAGALAACDTVPITGRKTINLVSDEELFAMSFDQYAQFSAENTLSGDKQRANQVARVGHRIQGAVEKYFANEGLSKKLEGYAWEFKLFESEEVNAWCMPGGKVAVYTGILPITQHEPGLATVMGHEIAHAIAEHGNERMSRGKLLEMGSSGLSKWLGGKKEGTQKAFMTAYGVGSQYGVMLPHSRKQESEADRLGIIFMAMAGYDPNEAIPFWERMSAEGGKAPMEFLSTHPSGDTRIQDIRKHLPEAMGYYYPEQ